MPSDLLYSLIPERLYYVEIENRDAVQPAEMFFLSLAWIR